MVKTHPDSRDAYMHRNIYLEIGKIWHLKHNALLMKTKHGTQCIEAATDVTIPKSPKATTGGQQIVLT